MLWKRFIKIEELGRRYYRKGSVKSFKQIPGPLRLPFIGNLWAYSTGKLSHIEYHKTLDVLFKDYGPLVKEQLGTVTVVHVFSPDDLKILLADDGKSPWIQPFQETAQHYRKNYNLSPGLGNVNGEEWYRMRNAVRKLMLTPKSVQYFLPRTNLVVDDFISNLYKKRNENNQIPGLRDEIGKWIQESAGTVCFEKRLGFLEEKNEKLIMDMLQAVKTIFYYSGILKFSVPFYKYLPTPKYKKLVEYEEFSHHITHNFTVEALEDINNLIKTNKMKSDQYTFLMTLLNRDDLNESDISALTHNLMVDGLTMTSPAMLANLFCLATYPEVQEKAYKEVSSVLKKGEAVTPKILDELPYIKAVVKETFRLYPIFFEIARILQKDTVLSGYMVPKGTYVSINMNVNYKDEKYFKEPDKFNPERYIKKSQHYSDRNHRVLIPFGLGSRACIGRRFAEQDLHTGLAKILLNFKLVQPKGGRHFDQIVNTSLYPKYPLDVQFVPR